MPSPTTLNVFLVLPWLHRWVARDVRISGEQGFYLQPIPEELYRNVGGGGPLARHGPINEC
jgi:hypothetical protein